MVRTQTEGEEEMSLLLKDVIDDLPLQSSLFYMLNGQPHGTWDFLARDAIGNVGALLAKQVEYKCNLMTYMCYNMVDPNVAVVNPFKGCLKPAEIMKRVYSMQDPGYDDAELNRWAKLLMMGEQPGVYIVPTFFCGDDAATTRNEGFVNFFTGQVIRGLYDCSFAFNISSEASKTMDRGRIERAVANCKAAFNYDPILPPKPITVHLQWNCRDTLPSNIDFLTYEFNKNPWDGCQYSVADVTAEAERVLKAYEGYVWFQELAVHCESARARELSRAIRDLAKRYPRIVGLPGPV